MPKISVVMPAYNASEYVHSTLKTLLDQTYKDWEAVIVDGGSTDNTLALLDEYAKQNPNIHVFRDKCESAYEAIWKGINRSQGEFIYILCFSDGYLTNEWYAKCMEVMDNDPEVSLVWGIPFDLFEDPKEPGKEVFRPHYVFSHFLSDPSSYDQVSVAKRIFQKIKVTSPASLLSFIKKLNRSNITAARRLMKHEDPPKKQAWFEYWLETGTIFPDGNMCVAKKVLVDCFAPYAGNKTTGNWEDFFFTLNTKGYLSQCIPIPANFGRLNSGQLSELNKEYNDRNRLAYFKRLAEFRNRIKKDKTAFSFVDRKGVPISH